MNQMCLGVHRRRRKSATKKKAWKARKKKSKIFWLWLLYRRVRMKSNRNAAQKWLKNGIEVQLILCACKREMWKRAGKHQNKSRCAACGGRPAKAWKTALVLAYRRKSGVGGMRGVVAAHEGNESEASALCEENVAIMKISQYCVIWRESEEMCLSAIYREKRLKTHKYRRLSMAGVAQLKKWLSLAMQPVQACVAESCLAGSKWLWLQLMAGYLKWL